MRILAVIEAGTWVDTHIVGSLRDDGHQVEVFHYGTGVGEFYPRARRDERLAGNRALADLARRLRTESRLDFIFCYVYDDFLLPDTAAALHALDVPLVNYNVDMTNQWYRQIRTAPYFTGLLCAQKDNMHLLRRYNPSVRYFPMAARAALARGDDALTVPAAMTFVGTPTPYRHYVLNRLRDVGVPATVYGKWWLEGRVATPAAGWEKLVHDAVWYAWPKLRAEGPRGLWRGLWRRVEPDNGRVPPIDRRLVHGVVPDGSLAAFFRGSAVNLGITRMSNGDWGRPGRTQTKLRDFEVPLAGGFYLVEHVPEYAEQFRMGREVDTWRTVDELAEKARYYLEHERERRAIAAAGRARAERDHTWTQRFAELFRDLGLS